MTDSKTKVCKQCDIEKPLDQYYSYTFLGKIKGKIERYVPRCKDCYKENEKNKYVKRQKTKGIYTLTKEERKQLYDLIKSGKPLKDIRQEYEQFKKLNYGTIYLAVKPDRIEKLLC
jgi:hypothetical protein